MGLFSGLLYAHFHWQLSVTASYSPHVHCRPVKNINFLMPPNTSIAILAAFFGLFLLSFRLRKSHTPGSLPPGPKPLFWLGNIRDLTREELWLEARKWAKEYGVTYRNEYLHLNYEYSSLTGGICRLHVLGQSLVFLNTPKVVLDLMDKRGAIYSDRPHLVRISRNMPNFS